jgi:hypothetical protein
MSEQQAFRIACPTCKTDAEVRLYCSINVKTDPALRDELMRNRINQVTCPSCGFEFRVDAPLLYSDPERRLMLYWVPAKEDAWDEGEERFARLVREVGRELPEGVEAPEVHLVFSRVELVERIFMAEAGLNPRIVEYVKHLIYSRNGAKTDPAEKILLFNAQDSTDQALCFVIQDAATRKFEAVLHFARDAYTALVETFDGAEKSAELLALFPGPRISARALLLKERGGSRA